MNILDRLDELERESGIHGAIAYQDLLHVHGRALIDVARAARDYQYGEATLREMRKALAPLLAEDDGQTLPSGYAMDAQAREWAREAEDEAP